MLNETATASATAAATTPALAPRRRGKTFKLDADLREPRPQEGIPLTFRELCKLQSIEVASHVKCEHYLKKWLDDFKLGELPAWNIKPEQLQTGCKAMREAGYKVGTINRDLSQIGSIYKWAIKKEFVPSGFVSPTLSIRREADKIRYVAPAQGDEWQRIRLLAKGRKNPKFTLLVWLVMDTGARRSEITDRIWADFDLDDPQGPSVELEHIETKTGKPRKLYFSQETAALVRKLRPVEKWRDERVWGVRGASLSCMTNHWICMRKLIGRGDGFTLRDLRHMVAADLLKAGKGVSQVSQVLGNSSLILHTRYGHLDDSGQREIQAERLGLSDAPPAGEWSPVVEAKRRQAEREAAAPNDAIAEAQRLQLIAQEAMAAAMAAAQALAGMRIGTSSGVKA
jgi:integrase